MTTEEIKGRDVIAIRVRCRDRQAARDIAQEVVRCHRNYRNEVEAREVERGRLVAGAGVGLAGGVGFGAVGQLCSENGLNKDGLRM